MILLEEFDENRQAVVNPSDLIKPIPDMPKVVVSCLLGKPLNVW